MKSQVRDVVAPGPRPDAHFDAEVRAGLRRTPKCLPSKYFYDARGSALFESICKQPEYYLTRTELSILRTHAASMARAIGPGALVLEYGSGSGIKTRMLLAALQDPVAYVPVEISRSALDCSVRELSRAFPEVQMLPVAADFTRPVRLPRPRRPQTSVLVFFPGSTLGNFDAEHAVRLLKLMHDEIGAEGAALVGIDLQKSDAELEAAYNDAAGVTAAFTLNLLVRLNRELGANFKLSQFRHRAHYNRIEGRIETHILSLCDQMVRFDGMDVAFASGEAMLVEYSCKYTLAGFARMAERAGLYVSHSWTDPECRFAMQLLRRRGSVPDPG